MAFKSANMSIATLAMTPWSDRLVPGAGEEATDMFHFAATVKFVRDDNRTGRWAELKVTWGKECVEASASAHSQLAVKADPSELTCKMSWDHHNLEDCYTVKHWNPPLVAFHASARTEMSVGERCGRGWANLCSGRGWE